MDYRHEIKELLKHPFREVCGSSLSLKLIKIYSDLYEGGREVRACENSQRKYYELLIKEGYKMAAIKEEVKNRTCVPAWSGNLYSTKIGEHIHSDNITDTKAISLLEKGYIAESLFTKLPDGFASKKQSDNEVKIEAEIKPRKSKKVNDNGSTASI